MHKPLLLLFTCVLFSQTLATSGRDKIVFWNVGQGSWTTLITSKACLHVDAGGRHRALAKECLFRKNYLWFTHYDWDHINLAKKIFTVARDTCLMQAPPEHLKSVKKKFLEKIPLCELTTTAKQFKTLQANVRRPYNSQFLENNDSTVFFLGQKILITGDATQKMENNWLHKIPAQAVRVLLAGHHGSRTSLSPRLLKKLSHLQMVIVSAEKKKYGHPHKETLKKLRRAHIPMIKTEDFGSVAIEL